MSIKYQNDAEFGKLEKTTDPIHASFHIFIPVFFKMSFLTAILRHPYLIVGIGGGIGSVARAFVSALVTRWTGDNFPFGTIVVNVSGAVLMGLLAGYGQSEPGKLIFCTRGPHISDDRGTGWIHDFFLIQPSDLSADGTGKSQWCLPECFSLRASLRCGDLVWVFRNQDFSITSFEWDGIL